MARSAAARDGLSVGDWLTRRIYTESLQDAPETRLEPPVPKYRDNRDDDARRDRDELMHRLARTEAETESAFRRIDDTLRTLGRRLETTERSQNEAKISVHTAATEANNAAREQAQNINHLTRRVDNVERAADSSALRNAVRGLHQGVSRLAEQVAKTANDSSTRIEALARNIEEASDASRAESAHIAKDIGERLSALTEKLASSEERLDGIEDRVQEALGRHVSSVEHRFEDIAERLDHAERNKAEEGSKFDEVIGGLKERLDATEKHNQEALSEYRLSLDQLRRRLDTMDAAPIGLAPQEFSPDAQDLYASATPRAAPPPAIVPVAESETGLDLPPFPDTEPSLGAPEMADLAAEQQGEDDYPSASGDSRLPPSDADDEFPPLDEDRHSAELGRDYLAQARRAAVSAAEAEPRNTRQGLAGVRAPRDRAVRGGAKTELRRPLLAISAGLLLLVGVGYLILSSGILPATNSFGPSQAVVPPATANASETDFSVLPPVGGPFTTLDEAIVEPGMPEGALTTLPSAVNQAPTYSSNIDQYASLSQAPTPSVAVAPPPPPPEAAPAPAPAPAPSAPLAAPVEQAASEQAVSGQAVSGPELTTPQAAGSNSPSPLERLLSQTRGGSPAAALLVGIKYLEGDGVAVSDSEGARWLRTAAELGEPVAQYRLGSIFERGRGVPADPSQAAFWYEQAARSGNRKAMHNLAVAYADGLGVEKNLAEAARWFGSAADLGLTDSQFNLAVLYERGMGVPSSLNDAYKWYSIAAGQGDTEAQSRVEVLAAQLPEDQRLTAEGAASSYAPQPLDQAANEPPTLAQIQ